MSYIDERLAEYGVAVPDILLPSGEVDVRKWAVIACDQFTQDRDYWERVAREVGDAPSTLNMIIPEVYLEDGDAPVRIKRIHEKMREYAGDKTILRSTRRACVFVERSAAGPREKGMPARRGLILSIDLEKYSHRREDETLVRATEGTVIERIPPRMEIRRDAPLELPHVILLINDEDDVLMSLVDNLLRIAPTAYAAELMFDSGRVTGRLMRRENDWEFIANCLEFLARKAATQYRQETPFLFAVGDGNHSLAAAKAVWNEYKALHKDEADIMEHPARWAMVEVENIWDPALVFEPIHRAVYNATAEEVLAALATMPGFRCRTVESAAALAALVESVDAPPDVIRCGVARGNSFTLVEAAGGSGAGGPVVATVPLERPLDTLCAGADGPRLDYIHGAEETLRLAQEEAVGILLPPVSKRSLFDTIASSGPLPRKSFSMGAGRDKRFYLECRSLFL